MKRKPNGRGVKGFRYGRDEEVRVRSRKGVVHIRGFCGARLADGKITTRGAVTCAKCIEHREDRESQMRFESYSDREQQRAHDVETRRRHPVTNTWRAATREREGRTRYLAHWVVVPENRWSPQREYRLEEHRLYVERGDAVPSDSSLPEMTAELGGGYYCPRCAKVAERTGPDGRVWGTASPPELPPGAGELEPRDVVANYQNYEGGIGWVPYRDITIHETGRKLPRGNVHARYREWLRDFSKNWRPGQ